MNLDAPIRRFMTGHVATVSVGASLTDARTLMVNGGFHHVPVVDGEILVGMLSASDLLGTLKAQDPELADTGVVLDDRVVSEVMSRVPVTVSIDASVREAVVQFAEGGFHAVPVVAGSRLMGIFTTRDLARHLLGA